VTDRLPDVPMKATTIRFGETQWRLISARAKMEGVTAAQFIRDAAFGRAILVWGTSADPADVAALRELFADGNLSLDDLDRIVALMYPERPEPDA
jgi:hypothetical protein